VIGVPSIGSSSLGAEFSDFLSSPLSESPDDDDSPLLSLPLSCSLFFSVSDFFSGSIIFSGSSISSYVSEIKIC
jgi:hypothetical protein